MAGNARGREATTMTAKSEPQPAVARQAVAGPDPEGDLRTLFGQSIAVFAALSGPSHRVETATPAFFAAIGEERARTGVAVSELIMTTVSGAPPDEAAPAVPPARLVMPAAAEIASAASPDRINRNRLLVVSPMVPSALPVVNRLTPVRAP